MKKIFIVLYIKLKNLYQLEYKFIVVSFRKINPENLEFRFEKIKIIFQFNVCVLVKCISLFYSYKC